MDGRGRQRPLNDPHGNQGRTVNQSNPDTSTANDLASPCSSKIQVKETFAHGYSALDTTDSTQTLNGENLGSRGEICAARRSDAGARIERTRAITEMRSTRRSKTAEGTKVPCAHQSDQQSLWNPSRDYNPT
ncbi:unnamed protein product [Boreogadus saida]